MAILLDTGVLFARLNKRDRDHGRAGLIVDAALEGRWGRMHVTDHVVAELLTLVRARTPALEGSARALLPPDPAIAGLVVVHTSQTLFHETLEIFDKHRDRRLSFVDANLVLVAEELGIDRVATFDEGFQGLIEVVGDAEAIQG